MVALSSKFPQYFSTDSASALLDADDFVDILYDLKEFMIDEETLFDCDDWFHAWIYVIEKINGSINNRYIHIQRYDVDSNKYHVATSSSTLMKDSLGVTHNITPGDNIYVPDTEAGQSLSIYEEHLWVKYTTDFKIIS